MPNGLELHPLGWPETAVSSGCACLCRNLLSGLVVHCCVPERCCQLGRPMASPHCDAMVSGSLPAFCSLEGPWLMGTGPDPDHPEHIGIGRSLTSWKIRLLLASWQNFENMVEIP